MWILRVYIMTIVYGLITGGKVVEESHSNVRVRRLAGGVPTKISDHPFVASILHGRKHVCGGTLISKNVILTAAHCIFGRWYKKMSVILGSTHSNSGGDAYKVSKVSYHKHFIRIAAVNDVALLKIQGSAASNKVAALVTLFNKFEKIDAGSEAQGIGWDQNGLLKAISLNTISLNDCAVRYKEHVDAMRGHVCTTTIEKGPAVGDSGGPLLIGGRQAGILSTVEDEYDEGHTNSYTEIAGVRDWIEEEALRLNKPNQPPVIYHPVTQVDLEANRKHQAKSIRWEHAPFVVQIVIPPFNKLVCIGTIAGPAHVLTSAECAKITQMGYQVISYSNSLTVMNETRTVVESFPHEKYHINNHGVPEHDVGLLLVSPSFLGNEEVKLSAKKVYSKEEATIYGWNPYAKEIMQTVHGSITDDSECNEIYSKILNIGGLQKGQICMSTRHGNCLDDKGGPLIIDGHQVGIASWRYSECADFRYPMLYTKLTPSHRSWINDMIAQTFKLAKNEIL